MRLPRDVATGVAHHAAANPAAAPARAHRVGERFTAYCERLGPGDIAHRIVLGERGLDPVAIAAWWDPAPAAIIDDRQARVGYLTGGVGDRP